MSAYGLAALEPHEKIAIERKLLNCLTQAPLLQFPQTASIIHLLAEMKSADVDAALAGAVHGGGTNVWFYWHQLGNLMATIDAQASTRYFIFESVHEPPRLVLSVLVGINIL